MLFAHPSPIQKGPLHPMTEIRPLAEAELDAFLTVANDAYPDLALHTAEARAQVLERWRVQRDDRTIAYYGAFREGQLVGGMRHFDFTMNAFGAQVLTGGVGLVAVDLFHKKQHIAKNLIEYFLRHYRERGAPFAALYPFRPDFYKQMGFGYGTKTNEYRVKPADLPAGDRGGVARLTATDASALAAFYARMQASTHGLMQRAEGEFARRLANTQNYLVGVSQGGELAGYLAFTFRLDPTSEYGKPDVEVSELHYANPAALHSLLAFLRSQSDQVLTVVLRTQDAHFHELFSDPRNGSGAIIPHVVMAHVTNTAGVGIMYRVLDTAAAFRTLAGHDFGGVSLRLKIAVRDDFLPENDGSLVVVFREGLPEVAAGADVAYDAEIALPVAEFSSLLLGVVPFRSLFEHGLATLDDTSRIEAVDRLFRTSTPPICYTGF